MEVLHNTNIDAWLSLVERCVRDAEVAGSNPVASTPWQGHRKQLSFEFPVFFIQTALQLYIDAWLSLVERCVRDAEVAGSNPVASTPWQGHRKQLSFEFPVFFIQTALQLYIDAWLSLVERCVRDAEVAGSNPVASTFCKSYRKH